MILTALANCELANVAIRSAVDLWEQGRQARQCNVLSVDVEFFDAIPNRSFGLKLKLYEPMSS